MAKIRTLMLLSICFAAPVQAGLFSDDEARQHIQQVEVRVQQLEDQSRQQTKSALDLQGQLDVINGVLRELRGQNEETAHGLQDAEKREKDFYVDLDTRLRHFESQEVAAVPQSPAAVVDVDDPAAQNRAIEAAYALVKTGNYLDAIKSLLDFLQKYPVSVYVPDATLWLANAQFTLKDYKTSLLTYRELLKISPDNNKSPEVLFNIALCQLELKATAQARATLKQLLSKYPDSAAAAKAKKLLDAAK